MTASEKILLNVSRRAMATDFELMLHRDLSARQVDDAVTALDSLEAIEADLTVYNPSSTISRVNKQAGLGPVPVNALVVQVIQRSLELCEQLDGAFDLTAGPLVEAWGFENRSGKRPSSEEIAAARDRVGWQKVQLDIEQKTVFLAQPNMKLNFGAIGKGFALDQIAARLRASGIEDFLLHGGNSSILAGGHEDRSRRNGWMIGLSHPRRAKERLAGLRLFNQGLGTSGSGKQFFHIQGKRYGHVIDPRTGYPCGDCESVTVIASDATTADAVATGLFVKGLKAIEEFAEINTEFKVVVALPDERQNEVKLKVFNVENDVDLVLQ